MTVYKQTVMIHCDEEGCQEWIEATVSGSGRGVILRVRERTGWAFDAWPDLDFCPGHAFRESDS